MKHTQESWRIGRVRGNNKYEYRLLTSNIVIADIEFDNVMHFEEGFDEIEANAKVIGAAGALLEACVAHVICREAKSECDGCERESVCHGDLLPDFMIKAAIAKATT